MAVGERFLRIASAVLIVLGVAALVVRPKSHDTPAHMNRPIAADVTSTTARTSAGTSSIATSTSNKPSPTATTSASPANAAEAGPCGVITKHGPGPTDSSTFSDDPRRTNERVLATGSYAGDWWRLSLSWNAAYHEDDLNFDYESPDGGGGGGGGGAPKAPLNSSSGNVGKVGWEYDSAVAPGTACVVATTNSGKRIATDEFYKDAAHPNLVFFVVIVPYDDQATRLESFDADGHRTGTEDQYQFSDR
jgi:hypothetical protein